MALPCMEQKRKWAFSGIALSNNAHRRYKETACVTNLAARCCTVPVGDISIATRVMEAWGFTFKTVAFVWVKQNRKSDPLFWGMGYWTRANAELCLLATRGHPKRAAKDVHQVIISHVEKHSRKPDEVRKRIERLMGDQPRIELFAREKSPGWDVWGNEVDSDIELSV